MSNIYCDEGVLHANHPGCGIAARRISLAVAGCVGKNDVLERLCTGAWAFGYLVSDRRDLGIYACLLIALI